MGMPRKVNSILGYVFRQWTGYHIYLSHTKPCHSATNRNGVPAAWLYRNHVKVSESVSHSVTSYSYNPRTVALRLLCPWNAPGKNTGVGSLFLLQGIFLAKGMNLGLLNWQVNSLLSELPGKPRIKTMLLLLLLLSRFSPVWLCETP